MPSPLLTGTRAHRTSAGAGGALQDLVFRKVNESDATKFAQMTKVCPAQFWGVLWCLISLAFMTGAIIGGIAAF